MSRSLFHMIMHNSNAFAVAESGNSTATLQNSTIRMLLACESSLLWPQGSDLTKFQRLFVRQGKPVWSKTCKAFQDKKLHSGYTAIMCWAFSVSIPHRGLNPACLAEVCNPHSRQDSGMSWLHVASLPGCLAASSKANFCETKARTAQFGLCRRGARSPLAIRHPQVRLAWMPFHAISLPGNTYHKNEPSSRSRPCCSIHLFR